MQLDRALSHIGEIHAQVLRSEVFRGYRAFPVAVTGALALVAAMVQEGWPGGAELSSYLAFWVGYAVVCGLICGADVLARSMPGGRRSRQHAACAVLQFVPAAVVGLVLTVVLMPLPDVAYLLPGLWTLAFALGVFASLPYLPRALGWVAVYYLVAGCAMLWTASPIGVPSPWSLGLVFGVGQGAIAWLLRTNLES